MKHQLCSSAAGGGYEEQQRAESGLGVALQLIPILLLLFLSVASQFLQVRGMAEVNLRSIGTYSIINLMFHRTILILLIFGAAMTESVDPAY